MFRGCWFRILARCIEKNRSWLAFGVYVYTFFHHSQNPVPWFAADGCILDIRRGWECSRIEGCTRGRRRQRWMGERTRVVVMSRAQANCCRLLSASLCKSTEMHGTGGRESVAFLRRWVLQLSTARLQGVATRSFSLARPSLAAFFVCCVLTGASRGLARWCERRRSGNSADGDISITRTGGPPLHELDQLAARPTWMTRTASYDFYMRFCASSSTTS